jgi:hypothetical protein
MRALLLKACAAGLSITAAVGACSSIDVPSSASGSAAGAGGAASDATSNAASTGEGGTIVFVGSGGSGGQIGGDAGIEDAWVSDGGDFDCKGCACPSATHYCETTSGGAPVSPSPPPPTPPQPGSPKCEEVDASTSCVPVPDKCVQAMTCDCIKPYPFCDCENDGTGFYVKCVLP